MTSAIHQGQHQQQRNQPLSTTTAKNLLLFFIKKKSNKYSPIQRQFRRTSSRNIRFVDANVLNYQSYAPHCCAKRALHGSVPCSRPVMAITASVQPESCVSDPTFRIRFVSVLPKIARIILCKTDPGPIWMAWSGSGRTDPVRKQAHVHTEIIAPGSCRIQPVRYQFSTFRLGCVLPQTALIILCKTSPDPIWSWLTVSGFDQPGPIRIGM